MGICSRAGSVERPLLIDFPESGIEKFPDIHVCKRSAAERLQVCENFSRHATALTGDAYLYLFAISSKSYASARKTLTQCMGIERPEMDKFAEFTRTLEEFFKQNRSLVEQSLSNIFSMREVGNKTHGDMAEVAIAKFIQSYIPGFDCRHVGKALFRAKEEEEDILVITPDGSNLKISLKAYGDGPLQLSTNKDSSMFSFLKDRIGDGKVSNKNDISSILSAETFNSFYKVNVLPLIYDEKKYICKIVVFDVQRAFAEVTSIEFVSQGSGRKHPIYKFSNREGGYIFEVRYGDASANALQRGLWTHTKNAENYFKNLTDGWIKYQVNYDLLETLASLLVSNRETISKVMTSPELSRLTQKKLITRN